MIEHGYNKLHLQERMSSRPVQFIPCSSASWRRVLLLVLLFSFILFYGFLYKYDYENIAVVYTVDSYSLPCEMPKLDPFDPVQLRHVKKILTFNCDGSFDVVYVDENNILQFNESVVKENQLNSAEISCMCQTIQRTPKSDESVLYSSDFQCDPPFNIQADFFKVRCSYQNKEITNTLLTQILRSKKQFKPSADEHYNVILFGIDSVSTNDAFRQIPKTVEYLQRELNAIILSMYNRIGGHTFDNVIPILTGLLANTNDIPYLDKIGERFEKFPFIWRNFSSNDYVTFYAEDHLQFHTFNFQKEGFSTQPTDHYIRPFWLADFDSRPSKLIFWKENFYDYNKHKCLGNVPKYLVQINYLKQFIHTYRKERKFAMCHINDLSHQDVNDLHQADDHLTEFFRWLKSRGHLNNTFLIVYSDHGPRGQSQTHQSLMETNLPFLGIIPPSNFSRAYPNLIKNMRRNVNILTTHFDLFATLRDILNRQFMKPTVFPMHGKPRGMSLFRNIEVQRSCKEASIPEQFCMCYRSEILNQTNNPLIQEIAQSIVSKLNSITSSENKCARLKLKTIVEARVLVQGKRTEQTKRGVFNKVSEFTKVQDYSDYKLIIETVPGNGKFYATSKMDSNGNRYILDDIERVNRYNNQSACISDDFLRPVCYCIT